MGSEKQEPTDKGKGITNLPSSKIVVMHLIAAMDIGGAEKVVLNLVSQKNSSNYDIRVAGFVRASDGSGNEFLKAVTELGAVIDKIPIYKRFDPGDIWKLIRIIKCHNVTILHTHGYKSDIVGVIAAKITGIRVVATAHGFVSVDSKLRFNEKLGIYFLRFAKRVICVSENIRSRLIASGLKSDKLIIIPNAVDFGGFEKSSQRDFRKEWNVSPEEVLIGSAGRFSPEKGHVNLVKAVSNFPENMKKRIKIVIAGDGPQKTAIANEAQVAGLHERLILPGFVDDMNSFYKSLDIFCLPSLTEGLPLTVLEAAASEKPIVASDVGSIGKLIQDGDDGLIVPPGDIDKLSTALAMLVESKQLRQDYGCKLKAKLRKSYDIKDWANSIFNIYKEALE